MNALGIKKLVNAFLLFLIGVFLPFQLTAQCDTLDVTFTFSYLSEDTILVLNTTEGFDTYEWSVEGGQRIAEYDHSLFIIQQADSLTICLTGKTLDDCQKTVCKQIFSGYEEDLCHQTDCIWPGDANGDRKANHYDLLNIGLGWGATGPPRTVFPKPEDPIFWAPTFNANWEDSAGMINYKHLDCDGNGVIEEEDLLAIYKNYTPATNLNNQITKGAPPVQFALKSAIEYQEGSPAKVTIIGDLMLGSLPLPVEDLHGLALRLRFPDQPFDIESIHVSVEDTDLLGATDELLTISRRLQQFEQQDLFDLSLSKKHTTGSSGFGKAVSISIISADIIELINVPNKPFKVVIEGLILIDPKGDTLQYDIPVDTACVDILENVSTSSKEALLTEDMVEVMPNPSAGNLMIRTTAGVRLQQYTLMNTAGQVLERRTVGEPIQTNINLHPYRPGWYILKIQTDKGVLSKKVLKIR